MNGWLIVNRPARLNKQSGSGNYRSKVKPACRRLKRIKTITHNNFELEYLVSFYKACCELFYREMFNTKRFRCCENRMIGVIYEVIKIIMKAIIVQATWNSWFVSFRINIKHWLWYNFNTIWLDLLLQRGIRKLLRQPI